MIRPAVSTDMSALVRMAADFHGAVPHLAAVPFSPLSASASIQQAMASPRAVVLVAVVRVAARDQAVGVLAAHEVDYPGGPAIFGRESLFWIDPAHRGRFAVPLLRAYEDWAQGRGIRLIGMTCFDDGRTARLMTRQGYAATEVNFVKAI